MMKICTKCHIEKPYSEFYMCRRHPDGYFYECKACKLAYEKERRNGAARQQILKYDRERAKRVERKASAAIIQSRWKSDHPDRRAAQVAVGNAVRDGRLDKLHCFICGADAEAHHPDYSRPLDVVWLCPSHHKQAHAQHRAMSVQY